MKSVSILGCGWFGLPLAQHLIKKGYQIKGSTTTESKISILKQLGIESFLIKDELTVKSNEALFNNDIIVINIPPRNIDKQEGSHYKMMQTVASLIPNQTHVIFISSTAVYPNTNGIVTEEDASYDTKSRGGVFLREIEDLFIKEGRFNTTIVRFAGLYNEERHPGRFLSKKPNVDGKENPINMIHLEDCIGVIDSIISQSISNTVLNACSPNHPTKESFYGQSAKALNITPPNFSDIAAPYKYVSSDKLLELTGYEFKY